ncbi:MAG: hypothetical protein JEZ05_03505 [Tenericutes bacterium]|nr:hypothetical protein [Mycoplasmatota bacterium]
MKTIDDFYQAYYKIDGVYHTNMLEVIDYDNPEDVTLLNEALLKLLSDGEILFVLDDNTEEDVSAFVLYRKGDKILNEFILFERNCFVYDAEFCDWQFPEEAALNKEERIAFFERLNNLIVFDNLNLEIKNASLIKKDRNLNEELIDLRPTQVNIIKILAFFWRYIYIAFAFGSAIILRFSLEKEVSNIVLGISILIYAIYFFIGIRLQFKHVYYAIQKNLKRKVDLNNMTFNAKDLKNQTIFLLVIGVAALILIFVGFIEL